MNAPSRPGDSCEPLPLWAGPASGFPATVDNYLLLRLCGHEVHTVLAGPARKAGPAEQPDVVLLGISVPVMDG